MGLPDRDSASTWGGKLLVDRDGTEIGTCTQIFLDDATGLPEWAQADVSGGPGVVPLIDASASGDRVRVAVRATEVQDAPRVDDPLHISEDEEERLYRHYGITYSREDSESLLPVDGPTVDRPVPADAMPESIVAEPVVADPVVADPIAAEPVTPTWSTSSTAPADTLPVDSGTARSGLLPALAAGTVGALAAVAAGIFWWRRRQQMPPTRKELLAARARTASLALTQKKEQVLTSAAPLVASGRRASAAAAQQAAVQARLAAERAAVQARVAAQQASVVAANARAARLQRGSQGSDVKR